MALVYCTVFCHFLKCEYFMAWGPKQPEKHASFPWEHEKLCEKFPTEKSSTSSLALAVKTHRGARANDARAKRDLFWLGCTHLRTDNGVVDDDEG